MYRIQTFRSLHEQQDHDYLSVETYSWGGDYRPKTRAELIFLEDAGFLLTMRCQERDPAAVYTQDDDPVYTDSCMEAFLNFYPAESDRGYLNFEMNANGALLCQIGPDRFDRRFVRSLGITPPKPEARVDRENGFWEVKLLISLKFIQEIYGRNDFAPGHRMTGNFYKCGDNTAVAHFGSWQPIQFEKPCFHLPEFFGELVLA